MASGWELPSRQSFVAVLANPETPTHHSHMGFGDSDDCCALTSVFIFSTQRGKSHDLCKVQVVNGQHEDGSSSGDLWICIWYGA